MKPKFIVLEGIDGTGKTTACERIKEFLESKGHKVKITAEPSDSDIGKYVRTTDGLTPEVEALLFVADRGIHTEMIRKDLMLGYSVVCDRYYLSTLAYQSASGLDMRWLKQMNSKVVLEPDVTIVLDVDPKISLGRVCERGETTRFEKLGYQRKVRRNFLSLAKSKGYKVIDATAGQEEVVSEIIQYVSEKV